MKKLLFFSALILCISTNIYSQIIEDQALVEWINPPANLVIPNEVETIRSRVFKGNTKIKTVDFNNVKIIESGAFTGCKSIENVKMPNVVRINARAMEGVIKLKNLYAPKCLVIQAFAFNGCTGLTSVELPSVKVIDRSAFKGCTSLTTVDLSKAVNLTRIGATSLEYAEQPAFDPENKNLTILVSDESKISLFPPSDMRQYTVEVKK